jgi:hypothetical protein
MNLSDYIYLIQKPEAVTPSQTKELKIVLDEFPYFHSARAVYLKGLKNQGSFLYNDNLRTMAAHTTNRTVLFDFISSETFNQHAISKQIKDNEILVKNLNVVGAIEINPDNEHPESVLSINEAEKILDKDFFHPEEIESVEENSKEKPPVSFNPNERHSFEEWLKFSFKTVQTTPTETTTSTINREKKFDLIERFIEQNPKIIPNKETAYDGHLVSESSTAIPEIMTETLAKVYVAQKKYKKAIRAYKILSLKYPEKSGFFADQIRAITQLDKK